MINSKISLSDPNSPSRWGVIFTSALGDYLRPTRIAVWIAVGLAVAFAGLFWLRVAEGMDQFQAYGQLAQFMVYKVLALAAAIFSTMVVSQEVEQKTIVYLLTRNLPRWSIILFRTLAAIFAVILVSWFACIGGGIGVLGFQAFQTPAFWRDMGLMVLGSAAYCSLFVFVSLLINKAMAICLLFAFGWEFIVPNLPGDLFYLSIFTYLRSLASHEKFVPPSNDPLGQVREVLPQATVQPGVAVAVLLGLTLVLLLVSLFWFSSFEYSPREDGD